MKRLGGYWQFRHICLDYLRCFAYWKSCHPNDNIRKDKNNSLAKQSRKDNLNDKRF